MFEGYDRFRFVSRVLALYKLSWWTVEKCFFKNFLVDLINNLLFAVKFNTFYIVLCYGRYGYIFKILIKEIIM